MSISLYKLWWTIEYELLDVLNFGPHSCRSNDSAAADNVIDPLNGPIFGRLASARDAITGGAAPGCRLEVSRGCAQSCSPTPNERTRNVCKSWCKCCSAETCLTWHVGVIIVGTNALVEMPAERSINRFVARVCILPRRLLHLREASRCAMIPGTDSLRPADTMDKVGHLG
jgi:hypothetical protein